MFDQDGLNLANDTTDDEIVVVGDQIGLFDSDEATVWHQHWQSMPEYEQNDLRPVQTLLVHFATLDDLRSFAQLLEQTITPLTKSIWYPRVDPNDYSKIRWATDEP